MSRVLTPTSHRYMLRPDLKPFVKERYAEVKAGFESGSSEESVLDYLDSRVEREPLISSRAAQAVGQLQGVAWASRSTIEELVDWANRPDECSNAVDVHVNDARRFADLDAYSARDRYRCTVDRGFARKAEIGICEPELSVMCEGCKDCEIIIEQDGTVHCLMLGTVCLFEWLPITDSGGRVPFCSDCAAEAFEIQKAGFGPLHLAEFRKARRKLLKAREARPDTEELYKSEAMLPFYEVAMRKRRQRRVQNPSTALTVSTTEIAGNHGPQGGERKSPYCELSKEHGHE